MDAAAELPVVANSPRVLDADTFANKILMEGTRKTVERKVTDAAREAAGRAEASYSNAAHGALEYQRKVLEIAQANVDATFEYAHELTEVRSIPELVELSTAHARKQFEAMTAQTNELAELAQKVTTEIAVKDWRQGETKESNKVA